MKRIFCDFDGTITEKDMIISFLEEYNPPGWREIVRQILDRKLSQGEGLQQLYRLIPSAVLPKLLLHVMDEAVVREGFSEFVDYCQEHDYALTVISGGLEEFVRPIVELYGVTDVRANQADVSSEHLQVHTLYPCDALCEQYDGKRLHCAPCKPSVIRKLIEPGDTVYVIGDSVSDLLMARLADHVFARGYLYRHCREAGIPSTEYETFCDVIRGMEQIEQPEFDME